MYIHVSINLINKKKFEKFNFFLHLILRKFFNNDNNHKPNLF